MRRILGLKTRLISGFLLATVLPLFFFGMITVYFLASRLEKDIAARTYQLARSVAGEVSRFLVEPQHVIRLISDHMDSTVSGDTDLNEFLQLHLKHHDFFESLLVLDSKGVVTHAAPYRPDQIGVNMSGQPFVKQSDRSDKPHWSPVIISLESGMPTATLAYSSGRRTKIGNLKLISLKSIVDRTGISRNSFIAITDQEGTVIAHTDWKLVREQQNMKDIDVVRKGLQGENGTYSFGLSGKLFLGSVERIPDPGWCVLVAQPKDEAFALISNLRNVLIVITFFILLTGTGFFLMSISSIVAPIRRLTENSKRIARGEYLAVSGPPLPATIREVAELSTSFDAMIEAVRSRENALKESEEHLRIIYQSANDGIAIIDPETGVFFDVNYRFTELLGRSGEDCRALRFGELVSGSQGGMAENLLQRHANSDNSLSRNVPLSRKDGSIFYADISSSLVMLSGSTYLMFIVRDVTAQRQVEEELRISEEKFSLAFRSSPDALSITSASSGRMIDLNENFAKLSGYSLEEARGRTVDELGIWREPSQRTEFIKNIRERGTVRDFEFTVRTRDGSTRECLLSAESFLFFGEPCIVSIMRDVSEQKKLEAQLRQAQKMESIGQLAGGIAHDFNNLLSAVIGYASLIEMRLGDNDALRDDIRQILSAADRGAKLTASLLAFSRKQMLNPRPVNVNSVLANLHKIIIRIIGEDIHLTLDLCAEDLTIFADSGQIEQVMLNLMTNARDAMPRGGDIRIETRRILIDGEFAKTSGFRHEGEYALVTVSDTGSGMDETAIGNIFEPFYTTKEVGKGTGLGLSIVYGIVTQHKGHVTVASKPGAGSRFSIYLPVHKLQEPSHGGTPAAAIPVEKGAGETVLIAEDDDAIRKLMTGYLADFGYQVIPAVDGRDAVNKFTENRDRVKLLIFDVMMPGMNGMEAYELIKRDSPEIRVLFTSGYAGDILSQRGIADKDIRILYKPVLPAVLLQEIRKILAG